MHIPLDVRYVDTVSVWSALKPPGEEEEEDTCETLLSPLRLYEEGEIGSRPGSPGHRPSAKPHQVSLSPPAPAPAHPEDEERVCMETGC